MNNRTRWIPRAIMTIISIVAVGTIFYNSSLDAVESTSHSSPLVDGINGFLRSVGVGLTVTDHVVRKGAHFFEYAVLGALLSVTVYLYVRQRKRTLLITLPIGLAVAVCDELIQLIPAGRSCEVKDMAMDFSGVLIASLLVQLILRLIERHRKQAAPVLQREL